MNDRIKELEKQATTVVEGWSDENGTTRHYEFNRKKFAEMIVEECARRAEAYAYMSQNFIALAEELRRMNGVEE